ncbi:uncharacterized protein (TIRG00374 family) [Agrobacterium larrymoorei]|uniref:Uncharacterized protein (TIRG00374 family) n=1 Tax=Agrobacterium larrymoorei TaxID=160699 RepID=A0ABU0UDT1_9HYPH|nr:uncharacterized protein (TIRG00374 family) [Agrobacterium larrymoorei]
MSWTSSRMQRSSRLNKLRIVVSFITLAFLIAIILRTDVSALGQSLSRTSWVVVAICLALVQVQVVLSALRWRFTSRRLGQDIAPLKAIREYYVASFLNQTLPGGVGGDAIRAWRMRGNEPGGWRQPAKAVIFERLSGQIAFFILAIVGIIVWPLVTTTDFGHQLRHYLLFAGALLLVAAFALSQAKPKWAAESALREGLAEVFVRRGAWVVQSITSMSVLMTYVIIFFIAADATGSHLPWVACLTIIPFCLVAMLIPTGFGGWGTREAAAMALWPLLGAAPVDGLAASITYGWLSLLGTAPGAIFLAASALKRRPSHA